MTNESRREIGFGAMTGTNRRETPTSRRRGAAHGCRTLLAAFGVLGMLGLAAALAGCESGGGREGISASAVQDPVLNDIPKPSGFRLVDKNSMAKASGQFRIAQCEYVGSKEREAVRRFYEDYMPQAGFHLKHWSLDKGTYALAFESDGELCDVAISPSGLRTSVTVKIGPKADRAIAPRGEEHYAPRGDESRAPRGSQGGVDHPPTIPVERRSSPPPRRRGSEG